MFLDAAAMLRERHGERFVFLIIGSGTEEIKLRETVSRLGLEDSVRFLGDRGDVDMILKGMDASVLCSFPVVETFPLADQPELITAQQDFGCARSGVVVRTHREAIGAGAADGDEITTIH